MAYVSLYRRFRPENFEKVIGQDHIIKTLSNQIKNDRINHSYLFTGSRGTGKTTCAKIFAKAVNCLHPENGSPCNKCDVCLELSKPNSIDIIEIDAASNNGVDEIRQLKENTQYRPSIGRYKVYIIDEVHMLSASAFNALLKTLEEPPEHIIFILATTEVQKIPATILSRCLRFDFRLVSTVKITNLISDIFSEIGIKYEKKAIQQIAIFGEGSVRDAISVADMCMSYCDDKITLAEVLDAMGASDFQTIHKLGKAILLGESGDALTILDRLYNDGRNTIHKDLCNYFKDLIAIKNIKGYNLDSVTEDQARLLKDLSKDIDNYRISRAMEIMANIETALRYSTQPRILFEATIVKACELCVDESQEAILVRIKELEQRVEKLKQDGITLEAKAPTNKEPVGNKDVESSPKKDEDARQEDEDARKEEKGETLNLQEELQADAVTVDERLIFEEPNNVSEEKVYSTWDKVIKCLTVRNERTLSVIVSKLYESIKIEEKTVILQTSNRTTVKLLNQPNFLKTLVECVKEVLGEDHTFVCQEKMDDIQEVSKGINQLKDLFGDTFKERR